MNLSAEQLQHNWETFMNNIEVFISEPRKSQLIEFYKKHEERIILTPGSLKKQYHNCFPGGYVDHVNNVVRMVLKLHKLWKEEGVDTSTYTVEEMVFSAINHDLGKIGSKEHEAYIPNSDKWRKEKLGEDYMFNTKIPFAAVPDRSLFLLQEAGISYNFNEMVAIKIHDGIYDEGNKPYYMGWTPEQKPRTALPYILHQADIMAMRIEWERTYLPEILGNAKDNVVDTKKSFTLNTNKSSKPSTQNRALKSIQSKTLDSSLNKMLNNINE